MKREELTGIILLITSVLLFTSCEKSAIDRYNNENLLIGTWTDTVNVYPRGYYVYELIFNNSTSFLEKSSSHSIYSGQDKFELSGWFERTGYYELNDNNIIFASEKVVSWDSFFGGEPTTNFETQEIFENCTFKINDNVLELSYIIYPADAPVNTIRHYKKQND